MTNEDRIRAMTDIELAEKLQEEYCPDDQVSCAENCTICWLRWLQQPLDAETLENLLKKIATRKSEDL